MSDSRNTGAERPLVSVVIISHNRRDDLVETIQTIRDQPYRPYEIVVVDNASTDDTIECLEAHDDVKIVPLRENAGTTGGRNAGVAAAGGRIVFFLDSDADMGRETLATAVARFEGQDDLGILGCRVLRAGTSPPELTNWVFSERKKRDQDREFDSFCFSECGCAVRRDVFLETGGFWDPLFYGREGEELSLRVMDAGYRIRYCPKAVVYHRISDEARVISGQRAYYDLRNCLYIYLARHPWWLAARFAPLKIGSALFRAVRRGHTRDFARAIRDVWRNLRLLRRERRPIKKETARYYLQLQRDHGTLSWGLLSWLRYKT